MMPSNHLILCHPLLILPAIFPSIRVFSNQSVLRIRWPKYWSFSFSFSPSNEHSGFISFRIDWFDLLAFQGTLKSSPAPQFESIRSSTLSLIYCPPLTSVRDYWESHNLDYVELCRHSNLSAFSIQSSHSVVSDSLRPHEPQHARPPCPSPTTRVQPNPCPLSW